MNKTYVLPMINSHLSLIAVFLFIICQFHVGQTIRCVQCVSDDPNCIHRPPKPLPCNGSDMAYCIILEERDLEDNLLRLTRTCSPEDIMPEECEYGIDERGTTVLVCHRACSSDGCNFALPSGGRNGNYYLFIVLTHFLWTNRIFFQMN